MLTLIFYIFSQNQTMVEGTERLLTLGPALCHRALPPSPVQPLYDALVCGKDLENGHDRQVFVDTGLIHLMVVSGSHLVFLEVLLKIFPRAIRLALLWIYCFITGFQAPVVRAFLRRLIGPALREYSGLTSLQIEAVTAVVALALFPPWLWSRSFLMSWMCGLALCTPTVFKRVPHFDQALKSYLFLLPFCWASPVGVAWNTLLAPFVGLLLFPACLLAMVVPPLVVVSDCLWRGFLGLLDLGPQGLQWGMFIAAEHLCWIPVVTHLAFLIGEVRWRRAQVFSHSYS